MQVVCPSVCPLTPVSCDMISLYLVETWQNICHVSGHCQKGFEGQRSKLKVVTGPVDLLWQRHTLRYIRVELS